MRRSSLSSIDVGISREIDSQYDDIKTVADNIDEVVIDANNISYIITVADNIDDIIDVTDAANLINNLEVSAETLNPQDEATVELVGNELEFGIPRGVNGAPGDNGLTPLYDFEYDPVTGDLSYVLTGYATESETVTIEDIV